MGSISKPVLIAKAIRLLTVGAVFISLSSPVLADQYDDQIAALRRQVAAQQAEVNNLKGQQNNLKNKLASINAEIGRSTAELQLAQTRHQKVSADLEAAKKTLLERRQILSSNLKTIYIQSQISPLEVFASAGTFTEYLDYQEYLNSLRQNIQSSITEMDKLKIELEKNQQTQAQLIAEQQAIQSGLNHQRGQAYELLQETRGLEANYQTMISANQRRIEQLKSAQAEMWARIQRGSRGNGGSVGAFTYRNWTGNQGACGGGYGYDPAWNRNYCLYGVEAYEPDRWQLFARQCVSYAAWKMAVVYGVNVPGFGGSGHAYQWPSTLSGKFRIDSDPNGLGVVVVIPREMIGGVGHVAVVEKVYGDGWIRVSQYNWGVTGEYSQMDIKLTSGLQFIHFR